MPLPRRTSAESTERDKAIGEAPADAGGCYGCLAPQGREATRTLMLKIHRVLALQRLIEQRWLEFPMGHPYPVTLGHE
jgi:hypothetical protein